MDKRAKDKKDRSKLRKEDIGIPVNFRHVQHVGFSEKGQGIADISALRIFGGSENEEGCADSSTSQRKSQSACTSPSPTFGGRDRESFFNQNTVFRKSDTSMGGKYFIDKENAPMLPYSSMSNLSIKRRDSIPDENVPMLLPNKIKPGVAKASFTGSLLNLNFFPFTRGTSNEKPRNGGVSKNKRLSLGIQGATPMTSSPTNLRPLTTPPMSPILSSESQNTRPVFRRRSSSFNGEYDFYNNHVSCDPKTHDDMNNYNSNILQHNNNFQGSHQNMSQIKKAKLQSQSSASYPSPPLSPTFDELPPPPIDDVFTNTEQIELPLPLTPSYDELPPPPVFPSQKRFTRKISKGSGGDVLIQLPPPPSPPSRRPQKSPLEISQDLPPPPLPLSPPPKKSSNSSTINSNVSTFLSNNSSTFHGSKLRGKLVRVNAPTLPPLSVPLIRSLNESPGTPSSWPLEPELPTELPESDEGGYEEILYSTNTLLDSNTNGEKHDTSAETRKQKSLTTLECMEVCQSPRNKSIDRSHIEPLVRLFQCRMNYKQWPIMMRKLIEINKKNVNTESTEKIDSLFNEVIRSTLELWLETQGGNSSLDDVVVAFEQTQKEIEEGIESKESDWTITKL